jgi:hypothetical protein
MRRSRGVFSGVTVNNVSYGVANITVKNNSIVREAPINGVTPCLSTPDGGPQVGGRLGLPSSGHVFTGNTFTATGDDAIAFFDVKNSMVEGNKLNEAFSGRGLMFNFTKSSDSVTSGGSGISFCNPVNVLGMDIIYQLIATSSGQQLSCPYGVLIIE